MRVAERNRGMMWGATDHIDKETEADVEEEKQYCRGDQFLNGL